MSIHGLDVSKSSNWLTPAFYFPALELTFDLDPAHPGRNCPYCTVPARRIYTVGDDGLRQPWSGLIWLNPPFNKRHGKVPWLRKFFAHGNGIALVTAYTSCDWFHDLVVPHAETLLFPRGKTKFIQPDGSIGKQPSTGSVLIGMGEIANVALERSGLGWFVFLRRPAQPQKIFEAAPTAPEQRDFLSGGAS